MSDKAWRTIHGCKCKEKYKIGDKEVKGSLCVYGGNDGSGGKKGTCPAVRHYKDLSKDCIKDAYRRRCIVEEQGKCGFRGVDWGGVLNKDENWDYCSYSRDEELQGTNAGVSSPQYKNPMKNIIGLTIFIFIFCVVVPLSVYKFSKKYMYSLALIANIPLLATALSFRGGLFDSRLFSFIYREVQETTFEKISRTIIYFISSMALLAITLKVSLNDYKKHKFRFFKIASIVIIYFIMNNLYIDITHFPPHTLPHNVLRYLLHYLYRTQEKKQPNLHIQNTKTSITIVLVICLLLVGIEGALLTKLLN